MSYVFVRPTNQNELALKAAIKIAKTVVDFVASGKVRIQRLPATASGPRTVELAYEVSQGQV